MSTLGVEWDKNSVYTRKFMRRTIEQDYMVTK